MLGEEKNYKNSRIEWCKRGFFGGMFTVKKMCPTNDRLSTTVRYYGRINKLVTINSEIIKAT